MASEVSVIVASYPYRVYADAIVENLRDLGIAAVVVPSNQPLGPWEVAVPTDSAERARLVASGLPGY